MKQMCFLSKFVWNIFTVIFLAITGSSESCPSACVCKWKGGKQTVECLEKALITVPQGIDGETQVLDVSGNNLQIIPREIFYKMNLTNLQRIHLKNCKIGQIGTRAFRGLTNLVELDLSHNLLTAVPSNSFDDTPFLRYLILASNPIQKIESNAFRMAIGLIKIDLSHCDIQIISAHAFDRLESLEWLKLNGNKLTELHPKTVEAMSKLHGLEFHENPWNCDCKLRSLKEWLAMSKVTFPVAPRCAAPDRVSGRVFGDLGIDEFACKPQILLSSRYLNAAPGQNATVTCRVGAVPPADVHWYWNGRLLLNNSALSAFQKILIRQEGTFERSSSLTLTNLMNNDSGEFHCVAENRAGTAEANFTILISATSRGASPLGKGQIAGLGIALVVLVSAILVVALVLIRRLSFSESKILTPQEVLPKPATNENEVNVDKTQNLNGEEVEEKSSSVGRDPFAGSRTLHPEVMDDGGVSRPNRNMDFQVFPFFQRSQNGHESENSYGKPPVCGSQPSSLFWKNSGFNCDSDLYGTDKTPIIDEDECRFGRSSRRCDYPPDYGLPMLDEFSSSGSSVHRTSFPENEVARSLQGRVSASILPPAGNIEPYSEGCGTDV